MLESVGFFRVNGANLRILKNILQFIAAYDIINKIL